MNKAYRGEWRKSSIRATSQSNFMENPVNKPSSLTVQKLRPAAVAVAMSLSALLTGCNSASESVVEESVIRPVFVEVVSDIEVADMSFNGTIHSANRADLSFRTNGRVVEILVREGDSVEKGQLIAKIDSVDAEIQLTSAKNELVNAQAEYQRAKTLFESQQSISKSQLEELTLRYNLAQNQFSEAQRRLEDTDLRAPFAGVISRTFIDNHVLVQGNEVIVALHDLSRLEAVIHVPESMMLRNNDGTLEIYAQSSVAPTEEFKLTLQKYETEPDPVTGTYAVTFSVATPKHTRLLPGMNVSVYSYAGENTMQAVQVPLSAISPDNMGNQYVWVVDEANALHKRNIQTGALSGERVKIKSNLQIGEKVVVSGTQNLQEGLVVRPELAGVK